MILASAQTKPTRSNIASNLQDHYELIEKAAEKRANLIVFPEMSITGYERKEARNLIFTENDPRLGKLKELAVKNKMVIVAGAPVQIKDDLFIGSFIIKQDGTVLIYTKQFLHPGEEEFFKNSFDYNPVLQLNDQRLSFAICVDITNPLHPENASKNQTTLYVPSIFFTPAGMLYAHKQLSNYARKYCMNVLMSNYTGEAWETTGGGRSAFWNDKGELIAELSENEPGLLLVEKRENQWVSIDD